MKKFKSINKRVLALLLSILMLISSGIISAVAVTVELADAGNVNHTGGYVYFLAPSNWTSTYVMMFIGRDDYTSVYQMTKVSNTENLYRYTMPKWDNAHYVAFANASSLWGSGNWGPSNRTNATHYTNVYNDYGFNSGSYYVVTPSGTSNDASITISYEGTSASTINVDAKANVYAAAAGTTSYNSNAAAGIVKVSGRYMSAYNTASSRSAVASTASNASASTTLAPGSTATFTAEASQGYVFEGWYSSASSTTALSTNTTYTYNLSSSSYTVYAKFKEQVTKVTATFKDWDGTDLGTPDTVNAGEIPTYNGTPPTRTGYTFTGWTADDGNFYSKDAALPAISDDTVFTATYSITHTVSITEKYGTGTITTTAGTITDGKLVVEKGTDVTLNVTAPDGYYISELNGDETTNESRNTGEIKLGAVNADVEVTIGYTAKTPYTVTINNTNSEYGSVDKETVTGYVGDKITITADPAEDCGVDYWMVDGVKKGAGQTELELSITGDHTVSVHWVKMGWTGMIYVEDQRTNKWNPMRIYTWNSAQDSTHYSGDWPGAKMNEFPTDGDYPVFYIKLDNVDESLVTQGNLKVILNNGGSGSGNQTGDNDISITSKQNYIILTDSGIKYQWSNTTPPVTIYLDNGTTDTTNNAKIGQTTAFDADNPSGLISVSELKYYTQDANTSNAFTDLGGYRKAFAEPGSNIIFTTTMETMNDDKTCDYYVAGWVVNGDRFVQAKYMGKNTSGFDYYQGSFKFTDERNTVVPIYLHTDAWLKANEVETVKVYAVGDPSVETWDKYMGAYVWYNDSGYEQFGMWQGQLMIPVEGLDNVYYTFVEKTTADGNSIKGITFNNFGYNIGRPSYPVTEYQNIQTYDYYEFMMLLEMGKENITFVLKPETGTTNLQNSDSLRQDNASIATSFDFVDFVDASDLKTPLDIDRNPANSNTVGLYIVRQFLDEQTTIGKYSILCHIYKPDGDYIGSCASYELLDIPTLSAKEGFDYLASKELDGKLVKVSYERYDEEDQGYRYDGEWYGDADVNVEVKLYAQVGLTSDNGDTFIIDPDAEANGINVANYGTAYAEGGAVATVIKGSSATISAVPASGYKFIGWYSASNVKFSSQSVYTIADVSFDTKVTAVFQELASDEFVITHELYAGGGTGFNPEVFTGTGDLYIGVEDVDGNEIYPMTLTSSATINNATEGQTYIIKIATDPHGADKFYSWYVGALDKFGNTTFEEVGVDNYVEGTEYGNLFDNEMDTVVGTNERVEFWFKHTIGNDFTLDLYSSIKAVSADVKLIYKYEDRYGATRTVVVPYVLTDEEVDAGYCPSYETVKEFAPYVDDYYTEVTWDIAKLDSTSFELWADQDDPVYEVSATSGPNHAVKYGTYNSLVEFNANTDFGAKSDKGYWFEDNGDGVYQEGEKIVAYGRYYGLRVTESVNLCYVEDDSIDFDIVLDEPVYTREQETDKDGNITTDKVYIDYLTSILIPLFRNSQTPGGKLLKDTYYNGNVIPNANSPVTIETLTRDEIGYEIEYGVILEQLRNKDDMGKVITGDEILKEYLDNNGGYDDPVAKNKFATIFNATTNPITNKNRILITIDMNNTDKNRNRYYNVYGYLKVKDDAGVTKYYFSDMRTLNIYATGTTEGDVIVKEK